MQKKIVIAALKFYNFSLSRTGNNLLTGTSAGPEVLNIPKAQNATSEEKLQCQLK